VKITVSYITTFTTLSAESSPDFQSTVLMSAAIIFPASTTTAYNYLSTFSTFPVVPHPANTTNALPGSSPTQDVSPISGIAVGVVFIILAFAIILWVLLRRRRRQKRACAGMVVVEKPTGGYKKPELDGNTTRNELGNNSLAQVNELETIDSERQELTASGPVTELEGEERAELAARGSVGQNSHQTRSIRSLFRFNRTNS
jgi:hypothetical protein